MTFRFFGNRTDVGAIKLSKLGQSIVLDEKAAEEVGLNRTELLAGRAPFLLPDELYKSCEFTVADEKQTAGTMARWTPEFREKWLKAFNLRRQWLMGELQRTEDAPQIESQQEILQEIQQNTPRA